jgi:hypothetical protein
VVGEFGANPLSHLLTIIVNKSELSFAEKINNSNELRMEPDALNLQSKVRRQPSQSLAR